MRDLRRNLGGGTGRIGRSESGDNDGNDSEAWDDEGSMGIKEKEVGVVSDCNKMAPYPDLDSMPLHQLKQSVSPLLWDGFNKVLMLVIALMLRLYPFFSFPMTA
jgi:hypothetical protein